MPPFASPGSVDPAGSAAAAVLPKTLALRSRMLTAAGIPHGFAMRRGGVSRAYLGTRHSGEGELNLGFTASDDRANVLENRRRLLTEIFGAPRPLVTQQQVHSSISRCVSHRDAGQEAVLEGDGLLADAPGLAVGILTADCVPVLVADPARGVVAAFHAGWRGTVARIVEHGLEQLRTQWGTQPSEMVAAVGPSIGACCYTVGAEVEDAVRAGFAYADQVLVRPAELVNGDNLRLQGETGESLRLAAATGGSLRFDLQEANRRQLLAAGLRRDAIDVLGLCTRCRNDLFFSYRAERGFTGRLLSVIGLPG